MNDKLKDILTYYAELIDNSYKAKLADSMASGTLINSVKTTVKVNGDEYSVVINLEEYWKNVEYGRGAGKKFPPVDKIVEWIREKPIVPRPYTLPSGKQVTPTENQLAFLIGRKISRDGIEAKNYLQNTIDSITEEMIKEINEVVVEQITTEIITDLKTLITK